MKRKLLAIPVLVMTICSLLSAQQNDDYTKIDIMLINGEINRVIDTCRYILAKDSLNAEIYYKMGLAYQNILPDDKSFDCFQKAFSISPGNNLYKYMVAKSYYGKGKMKQAKMLLKDLCSADSLNWLYAYYLTSIYMQDGMYDESLTIYKRFYDKDSTNYVILDKLGFVRLRRKEYDDAIELYNRSLAINAKNVSALKNLSFLYASTQRVDTALQLLSTGIQIDPSDMDLYVRRAALNYSHNYTKRALDDYLILLSSGDSTLLYLKRAGIGYSNNLQPRESIKYLLLAYDGDTTDLEVSRYIAENYRKLKNFKNSALYYNRIINTLKPAITQLGFNYVNLAEILKQDRLFPEAISAYLKSYEYFPNPSIYMFIANVYDENLSDIPNAIHYYELFLDSIKDSGRRFQPRYIESIRKRLEYLKTKTVNAGSIS
jgi:tetratricopeptide (TPR) repeat protein